MFTIFAITGIGIISLMMILVIYLMANRKSSAGASRILLASFLFLCALQMAGFLIYQAFYKNFTFLPYLFLCGNSVIFLLGPLLYLYIKTAINTDFQFRVNHIKHSLPFGIYWMSILSDRLLSETTINQTLFVDSASIPISEAYLGLGWIFSFCYLLAAYRQLKKHSAIGPNIRRSESTIIANWFKILVFGFGAVWSIDFLNFVSTNLEWISSFWFVLLNNISVISTFLMANAMVYMGLNQPEVFVLERHSEKYATSPLTLEDKQLYVEKLTGLMERNEPYLDPNLKISDLADAIGLNEKYLSQIINEMAGKNFFDFVNTYRIEVAKKKLWKFGEKKTILEIIYESGFNSKSVFNRVFKSHTGVTPTTFRNLIAKAKLKAHEPEEGSA